MVDPAVFEAFLSIPGAVHASRELLSRRKPDLKAALQELDTMKANLVTFSAVGSWFGEAKELHQNLQYADVALEPCVEVYVRATASGVFDPKAYSLGDARKSWNSAKAHALNRLIASFASMRHVEKTLVDAGDDLLRVPKWGVQTVQLKRRIDAVFAALDRLPSASDGHIVEAADALKTLSDHIKHQMMVADYEIRNQATAISKVLADVARDLKNG